MIPDIGLEDIKDTILLLESCAARDEWFEINGISAGWLLAYIKELEDYKFRYESVSK